MTNDWEEQCTRRPDNFLLIAIAGRNADGMNTMNVPQSVRDCVERHCQWSVEGPLGRIVLNRPERKNP